MSKHRSDSTKPPKLPTIVGWREWVALPELGIEAIKAKVDTGARSSALHAFDLVSFQRDGHEMIRFKIHPNQRDAKTTIVSEAVVFERRLVRSSGGHATMRPVIRTTVVIDGRPLRIELTLASRDMMGFRMLLGREAVRKRFLVDPGRSFIASDDPTQQFFRPGRNRE